MAMVEAGYVIGVAMLNEWIAVPTFTSALVFAFELATRFTYIANIAVFNAMKVAKLVNASVTRWRLSNPAKPLLSRASPSHQKILDA